MPGPSIKSVNSTSTSNVPGDWSQEGDFVNGIKITAFVFLTLSSMVDNALLIAVFNMAFANVLLTVYAFQSAVSTPVLHIATSGLSRANCFAFLSQFIGQMAVLVSTAWKFACDCF